ncbi:hypothetical protein NORO109296_22570 [Nocardiopsis rhodophaea]
MTASPSLQGVQDQAGIPRSGGHTSQRPAWPHTLGTSRVQTRPGPASLARSPCPSETRPRTRRRRRFPRKECGACVVLAPRDAPSMAVGAGCALVPHPAAPVPLRCPGGSGGGRHAKPIGVPGVPGGPGGRLLCRHGQRSLQCATQRRTGWVPVRRSLLRHAGAGFLSGARYRRIHLPRICETGQERRCLPHGGGLISASLAAGPTLLFLFRAMGLAAPESLASRLRRGDGRCGVDVDGEGAVGWEGGGDLALVHGDGGGGVGRARGRAVGDVAVGAVGQVRG